MEEDLLEYFTGQGGSSRETIKPQNVSLEYVPCKKIALNDGLVVNNQYYIRYGGTYSQSTPSNNYAAIEVYTIDTLDKGEALYIFDDLNIGGTFLLLEDLHQAEDGRFYGVGSTLYNGDIINDYFIIFNNFIQDGRLKINKYYSKTEMGLTQNEGISKVIKKENSGDYYFLSSGFVETNVAGIFIYHYKIDILEGNKLETYKIKYDNNSFMNLNTYTGASKSELKLINDNLVYMGYFKRTDTETPYREEYHSIVLKEPKEEEIYETKIVKINNEDYSTNNNTVIEDFLFKSIVLIEQQNPGDDPSYYVKLNIIDIDGNMETIYKYDGDDPGRIDLVFSSPDITLRIKGNYIIVPNGQKVEFYFYDLMNFETEVYPYNRIRKFYETYFGGYFSMLQVLTKYNLVALIGYGGGDGTFLSYEKNIFSEGYSSVPYYNNNFMIPQYLNLYAKTDEYWSANLFDITKIITGYWYNSEGNFVENSYWTTGEKIYVKLGVPYLFSRQETGAMQFGYAAFDKDGNFVERDTTWLNNVDSRTITFTNNSIAYIRPMYNHYYSMTNIQIRNRNSYENSIMYSRDVSNRFVSGNQLTATFNVSNSLLNQDTIKREIINGQTNLAIEDNIKDYTKNRFESLYMIYMYNMYIKDNTNGDNLINQEASNRIADSVWKRLDYQAVPLTKVRITYDDELSEIINLGTPTLDETTATYTFEVEGNIIKIEYLSNDENTVYATYRCNLTGHNTITQTIEVMEG